MVLPCTIQPLQTYGDVPMETPISTPEIGQPSVPPRVDPKKRVLWKWSIGVTLVLITTLLWRCGTGLMQGRELSANGVQEFHALLNGGQNDQIYDRASDAFRGSGNKEDLI